MSRIRTVKPEFWTSEQVMSCSPLARLLFIGLWNFSDDHGVHPASYIRLKAEVFPCDSFDIEEISCWMGELIVNNLVLEYVVDNKKYWITTGWEKHQRIDKPTFRHPLPLSALKIVADSTSTPRSIEDCSFSALLALGESLTTPLRALDDSSGTDRNGMESNGKEKDISEVETSPVDVSKGVQVFQYWQAVMNHPKARLDKKRLNTIERALKLYTLEELKQAIDGCAKTPFNLGQNDRCQKYDDIELILRDASHIDCFIDHATNPPTDAKSGDQKTDWMSDAI